MTALDGVPFLKMSGSGNDFLVFDVRSGEPGPLEDPAVIQALCARGVGVGADGVVLLENSPRAPYAMRYFNADGSPASLCGNATLCAARLGAELGIVTGEDAARGFHFETGVGLVEARVVQGRPEIELTRATDLRADVSREVRLEAGERRIGYVEVGVPHVVILCDDADLAPVMTRGRMLRGDQAFPHGANVNFVSRDANGWRYRTYERGVENETLACGTGAAACALLLDVWGESSGGFRVQTRSGSELTVALAGGMESIPRLGGSARIVFRGELSEI